MCQVEISNNMKLIGVGSSSSKHYDPSNAQRIGNAETNHACIVSTAATSLLKEIPQDFVTASRRGSSLGVALLSDDFEVSLQRETISRQTTDMSEMSMRSETQPDITRLGQAYTANALVEPEVERSFRPMVGNGAAAAYNALRHDFFVRKQKAIRQKRRMSSLSFGSAKASGPCTMVDRGSLTNQRPCPQE